VSCFSLKSFVFCLPLLAATRSFAWDPADVDLYFVTQNQIDIAIVLPELGPGGSNWFAPAQYGPLGTGFDTVNYQNPDYSAENFEIMGVDTEADGSLDFFVGVPLWDVGSVSGKSFSDVFPGYDESDVVYSFEEGLSRYGFANSTESDLMYGYKNTYNVGGEYGLMYLYSFSSGEKIGTVDFANPSAPPTPAPLAAIPFALGLLARSRRRTFN
jgi:hypothetical protein